MTREKRKTVSRDEKRVPRANTVQALAEEMERKISEEFRKELAKQNRNRNSAVKTTGVSAKSSIAKSSSGKNTPKISKTEGKASGRTSTVDPKRVSNAAAKPAPEVVPTTTELAVIPAPASSNTNVKDPRDDDNSFGVTGALATSPMEIPRFNYPGELRNRSRNSLGLLLMQMLADSDTSLGPMPPVRHRGRHLRPIPINLERMPNQPPHLRRHSGGARISMGRPSDRPFVDLVEFPFMPLLRRSAANRRRSLQQQHLLMQQQQQQHMLLQQQLLLQQQPQARQSGTQPQVVPRVTQGITEPPIPAAATEPRRSAWQGRIGEESEGSRSDESETMTDDYSALLGRDNEFVIIMEADDRDVLPFHSLEDLMGLPRSTHELPPITGAETRARRRRHLIHHDVSEASGLDNRVSSNLSNVAGADNASVVRHPIVEGTRSSGPGADATSPIEPHDPAIVCIRQLLSQVIRMSREGSTSGSLEQPPGQRPNMDVLNELPGRSSGTGRRPGRRGRALIDNPSQNLPIAGTRVLLRRPTRGHPRGLSARRARGWRARADRHRRIDTAANAEGECERTANQPPSPGKQPEVSRSSPPPQQGEDEQPETEPTSRPRQSKTDGPNKKAKGRGRP